MSYIKKTISELEKETVQKPWHDCGRQNFVIKDGDQIICLELKKDQEIKPDKKIIFKLEPAVFYNGEHPVYRN